MTQFNDLQKDKLLTFYFSDNDKSITGACVEFKFTICDALTGPSNTFFRKGFVLERAPFTHSSRLHLNFSAT